MSYLDEIVRQHNVAKEGFGNHYEFGVKQRDVLHLAKVDLQATKAKRVKIEYHIKKTKREIDKLYQHLVELEDKLEELTKTEDEQYNFLQVALTVKESDV